MRFFKALALLTATTYALTPNRNIKVARKNTLDSSVTFDEYQNIMVRSRRPVVTRLHAIDARHLRERGSWVVSFSISRPFGPSRVVDVPSVPRRSSSGSRTHYLELLKEMTSWRSRTSCRAVLLFRMPIA